VRQTVDIRNSSGNVGVLFSHDIYYITTLAKMSEKNFLVYLLQTEIFSIARRVLINYLLRFSITAPNNTNTAATEKEDIISTPVSANLAAGFGLLFGLLFTVFREV